MAGLSDAQQWEKSTNEEIQELAVMTYEKVDSPEAEAGLKRMSQSDSPRVRNHVQDALSRRALKAVQ